MNDFTKEELAIIHLAVMRDINQFPHILKTSPSMLELKDKLELMIDNYCEHEWSSYQSPHGNVVRCNKCNGGIHHP